MGMVLVGLILQAVTGKSYQDLLQEAIFEPLGMDSSTSEIQRVQDKVVPGLEKDGDPAPNWDMNAMDPCGGILTSAEDMALFVQAQFKPDPAVALTQEPTVEIEEGYEVGLGWHIVIRANGQRWLNHGGGMRGYTAIVNVNPARRLGVVVLSNLGLNDLADNVSVLGRELLAGLEEAVPKPKKSL